MYKKNLQIIYEKYIVKYPFLKKWIVRLYKYKKIRNSIKKKIIGKNNKLNINKAILINVTISIRGNNNKIIIEDGCVLINVEFSIMGNDHIILIKKNSIFSRGSSIWFEDNNGYLEIGEKTLIENVHFAITEPYSRIIVGEGCMFAYNIDIRTGDSHSIIDNLTKKRINYAKNILIGNHVWLSAHCKILKGVVIANNSVIATAAVVTKTVNEENSISAGNPAKVVKKNINWRIERIYDK